MEGKQPAKNKGGKHYTKKELALMKAGKIIGNCDNVLVPDFLTIPQKKEFRLIAAELERLGIMTNLDSDVLGQYIQSKTNYLYYADIIEKIKAKCDNVDDLIEQTGVLKEYENMKDKNFKQCKSCADALGLNITARCKIKKPEKEEKPPENKFAKFQKSG